MKTFIIKITVFTLAVWLLPAIYISSCKIAFLNYEYPMWLYTIKKIHSPPGQGEDISQLLVIGDSRAKAAYVSNVFGSDTLNLALGGSTPLDGYTILSHYLQTHPAPKKLILSYSPIHLEISDWFWERSIKWDLLTLKEGIQFLSEARHTQEWLGLLPWGHVDSNSPLTFLHLFLLKAHFVSYYQADLLAGHGWTRYGVNIDKLKFLEESHGWSSFGMAPRADTFDLESDRNEFILSPLLKNRLDGMFRLCKENKISVYYVTPPFTEMSFKKIKDAYKSQYRDFLKQMQVDFPEAHVDQTVRVFPDEEFGDGSHLKPDDAARFSQEISAQIQ